VTETHCRSCQAKLIIQRVWRGMTAEERQAARDAGFGEHRARSLCATCHEFHTKHGTLIDFERETRPIDELIEEVDHMAIDGVTPEQMAARLGMTLKSLAKSFDRARKKGLTDRYIPWSYSPRRAL
jgi:hypothetical protein